VHVELEVPGEEFQKDSGRDDDAMLR